MPKRKTAAGAGLAPTPASAWARPTETTILPLSSGRVVEVRALDLMAEILQGSLPNQILDWVVFTHGGTDFNKKTYQERVKSYYEARLMVVARGLKTPRLVLGPPEALLKVEADHAKGEIGPRDFFNNPQDVDEIYDYLTKEVVPDVATAPFPEDSADDGGAEPAAQPGDDVPHDAEPVPAPDGN